MQTVAISLNLSEAANTVQVASVAELKKFCQFAGGEFNVYVWTMFNEWSTVGEWCQSKSIEDLFGAMAS